MTLEGNRIVQRGGTLHFKAVWLSRNSIFLEQFPSQSGEAVPTVVSSPSRCRQPWRLPEWRNVPKTWCRSLRKLGRGKEGSKTTKESENGILLREHFWIIQAGGRGAWAKCDAFCRRKINEGIFSTKTCNVLLRKKFKFGFLFQLAFNQPVCKVTKRKCCSKHCCTF